MGWIVIMLLVLMALAFLVLKRRKPKSPGEPETGPVYQKKESLFSPAERSFLGVLDQAVGDEYRVFGKVRIADVVDVRPGVPSRQGALNGITAKHFDFLLCDKRTLAPVCTIELDDKSHQQRKRRERDAFLEDLCRSISLPLVRIPAQYAYSVIDVQAQVFQALGLRQVPALKPAAAPDEVAIRGMPSAEAGISSAASGTPALPLLEPPVAAGGAPDCPRCGGVMVRRVAMAGSNAGREFWGCTQFPKCRGMLAMSSAPTVDVTSAE